MFMLPKKIAFIMSVSSTHEANLVALKMAKYCLIYEKIQHIENKYNYLLVLKNSLENVSRFGNVFFNIEVSYLNS